MVNPWDIQYNLFVGTGVDGSQRISSGQSSWSTTITPEIPDSSAVGKQLADLHRFLQANNGTGELQPRNAETNAKLPFLYA